MAPVWPSAHCFIDIGKKQLFHLDEENLFCMLIRGMLNMPTVVEISKYLNKHLATSLINDSYVTLVARGFVKTFCYD